MKKRFFMSLVIMVIALTAMTGATYAWFTAETDPVENTFTAGTVEIEASEEVIPGDFIFDNWNPGDEVEKVYTITNVGTKNIVLRAKLSGKWQKKSGSDWVDWPEGDLSLVTFAPVAGSEANWDYLELDGVGYWLYKGVLDGTYGGQDEFTATFRIKVKLDGPGTDNKYQGKRFVLSAVFEAVQASHNASADVWGASFDGTDWTKVSD